MARKGEGTIEIPLEEFWTWVFATQLPNNKDETLMGVPKINNDNGTMEISYAYDSENDPRHWAEQSQASKEWDELDAKE